VARQLSVNLVALGSAAIVTIYGLGYALTQSVGGHPAGTAAASAGSPPAAAAATQAPGPGAPTAIARAIAAATQSPTATPGASTSALQDGTFNGTGTSRRGDISVALTIQNGQVSAVRITRATTYYSVLGYRAAARRGRQPPERASGHGERCNGEFARLQGSRDSGARTGPHGCLERRRAPSRRRGPGMTYRGTSP